MELAYLWSTSFSIKTRDKRQLRLSGGRCPVMRQPLSQVALLQTIDYVHNLSICFWILLYFFLMFTWGQIICYNCTTIHIYEVFNTKRVARALKYQLFAVLRSQTYINKYIHKCFVPRLSLTCLYLRIGLTDCVEIWNDQLRLVS